MELKRINAGEYEFQNEKYDFHLRKEGRFWILDVFNINVKPNNKAYIESLSFDSFKESLSDLKLYI